MNRNHDRVSSEFAESKEDRKQRLEKEALQKEVRKREDEENTQYLYGIHFTNAIGEHVKQVLHNEFNKSEKQILFGGDSHSGEENGEVKNSWYRNEDGIIVVSDLKLKPYVHGRFMGHLKSNFYHWHRYIRISCRNLQNEGNAIFRFQLWDQKKSKDEFEYYEFLNIESKIKNNDFKWFSEMQPTIGKKTCAGGGDVCREMQLETTMKQLLIDHVQSMLTDLKPYRESKLQPILEGTRHWLTQEQACWDVLLRLATVMEHHPNLKLTL